MKPGRRALVLVLLPLLSGCLATRSDVDALHDELNTLRAETAARDSVRDAQLRQMLVTLRTMNDSVTAVVSRVSRIRAETQGAVRQLQQDVLQVQEITGQSQQRIQEMRARMEEQNRTPTSPPPTPGDTMAVAADPAAPGPNQLYRLGRDNLARGSNSAARAALADLLTRYPDSDLAADAQFYVAESYAAERNNAAADTSYAAVVERYPASPRAATALYKRGVLAQNARRTTAARRLYDDLISRYPNSDEAALARERLRALR